MNRISGLPGEYPFDEVEKQKRVKLIREWNRYFTVKPIVYQVMGNHCYLVCYAPARAKSFPHPKPTNGTIASAQANATTRLPHVLSKFYTEGRKKV